MKTNIENTALSKFRTFCGHCTIHGFFYFSERHHWSVYLIWTAIIAFSSALCGHLSHMIWQKFSIDPTFTVVESTHYSTSNIPFPAVTVCDTEPVYGPNTYNVTNILQQRNFNEQQIEDFYNSFSGVQKLNYKPPDHVKKMHKALHDLGFTMEVLLELFAKPCEVLLDSCDWRSQRQNCTDMFRKVYTFRGYCCRFDMEYFKAHAEPGIDFSAGVQIYSALGMTTSGKKVSYKDVTSDGYVSLFVHADEVALTVVDSDTTLTPGALFDVNIYLWVIDSSDDVKLLSLESRKCILMTDDISTGKYYQECMAILMLRKVVDICRCLPFQYTAKKLQVEDYGCCSWDRMSCVYQILAKVKSNINEIVSENSCMQRCDHIHYETEIEYVNHNHKLKYRANDSLSGVRIHFSSVTCFKYRREVLYSWDQMIANLGGIFGLCLGGSIISIIELVWFIFDFTFSMLTSNRHKKVEPARKRPIFVLPHKDAMSKPSKSSKGTYRFVH